MPPGNDKNTPGNAAEVGLARSGKLSVLRGWLDRRGVALVVLASSVLWIFFLVLLTRARWGGDLRGFLCLGAQSPYPLVHALADAPRASPSGYDGQFYAALATDPLLRNPETLRAIDSPAWRATRIMIPSLAWLLGLGNPGRAVILYELLCWGLSLGAILLTAIWLRSDRASPWWAALLVLNGGLVTAINRSTLDGAALAGALAALWFHRRQRHHLALGLTIAATLTRETSYLVALSIALSELRAKRLGSAVRYAGLPVAFFALWQLYLKWTLGPSFSLPTGTLTLPFSSLVRKVGEVIGGPQSHQPIEIFGLMALVASFGALVALLTQKRVCGTVELVFIGFATLTLFLKYDLYGEAAGYARAFILLPFLGVLAASHQPASWRRWLLRSIAVFYMLVGVTSFSDQVRQATQGRGLLEAMLAPPVRSQPIAQLPPPGPATAAPSSVAASRTFYVLPAAHTAGRDGTQWRTDLRLQNLEAAPSSVSVDLLAENRDNRSPRAFHFVLQPNQEIVLGDVVQQLFGATGMAALRVVAEQALTVASRTYAATHSDVAEPWRQALSPMDAYQTSACAVFSGLCFPARQGAETRTNLGLLNLTETEVKFEVAGFDPQGSRLATLELTLGPCEFHLINEIFRGSQLSTIKNGSATLRALTPGASFLAYAALMGGDRTRVTHIFPSASPRTPIVLP